MPATLAQWLEEVERRHSAAIQLGLERIRAVLQRLHLQCPAPTVITVAGTNGKGSTVRFLEQIYRTAGYRVGAYTSPHLQRFNERIRIDAEEVGDEVLCDAFAAVEAARREVELTYFEFATAVALLAFSRAKLDVALLEVGLGGRLDAVNAVDPSAAAVVTVDLDHTEWLGSTREQIGWEKAHVYRAGAPAVCADRAPPASLLQHARDIGTQLWVAGRDYDWVRADNTWEWQGPSGHIEGLPLPAARGGFQLHNAACAISLIQGLGDRCPVRSDQLAQALVGVQVPGRMQTLERDGVQWVFDVGHNVQAAQALASALAEDAARFHRTHAVFGMMVDKDAEAVVALLSPHVDGWLAASLPAPRGVDGEALAGTIRRARGGRASSARSVEAYANVADACEAARRLARPGDRVVVFGSFLTVGPGLSEFGALPGR